MTERLITPRPTDGDYEPPVDSFHSIEQLRAALNESLKEPEILELGEPQVRYDIPSSAGPFFTYHDRPVRLPDPLIEAYGMNLDRYNKAVNQLALEGLEFPDTDYTLLREAYGAIFDPFVQIDTVGLPTSFLERIRNSDVDPKLLARFLQQNGIFEIEPGLAMVQLLGGIGAREGVVDSTFGRSFRRNLDDIRERTGVPIAMVVATRPKYQSVAEWEFGGQVSPDEVREISGFDFLIGPDEAASIIDRWGYFPYAVYMRCSADARVLRGKLVESPPSVLDDGHYRRALRRMAITPNIDAPNAPAELSLNDTKKPDAQIGLCYTIENPEQLDTPEFREFLLERGVDPQGLESGAVWVHGKPRDGFYGAYDHISEPVGSTRLYNGIGKRIDRNGPYVFQQEMVNGEIFVPSTGRQFRHIIRAFFADQRLGGPNFMGGANNMLSTDSPEVRWKGQKGKTERIHGHGDGTSEGSAHWRPLERY